MRLRDLRHLHAGRELELVAGDVRAGDRADDLRLDAEMAERLGEPAGGLLLAGGVGPHLLRGRALEDPRLGEGELLVGDRQLEVELLAPAGLRRGRRRGRPGRERRRGRDVQLGHRIGGGLLVQRLGLGLRPRRPGDRDLGRGAEEVRVAQHAVEGRARRARAHDRLLARRLGRPEERGLVRRRLGPVVGLVAAALAARPRVVSATRVCVALSTPATDAPVSSSVAATARKTAMMLAPTSENALAAVSWSARPTTPPFSRTGSPPAPNRRRAEPSRQIAPARNGRTAGSTGLITISAPAATSATGIA